MMSVSSCNLDINVDPNSPATVPSAQLLSSSLVAIFNSFSHNGSGLGQPASIWVHQVMIRSAADNYGSTGNDGNIGTPWQNLYAGALNDLETIIKQSTTRGEFRYVGIAKILKAYSYSMMVDVWGDIPFSEANIGPSKPFPKFDDDAAIYAALFPLIDEGIADIAKAQAATAALPSTDDLVYAGDIVKWRKFAKVLKLKMYNTIKGVQNVSTELAALAADADVTGFVAADDFEMRFFNVAAPENRNPGWISVSGAGSYFSIYFYEILANKSTQNTILGGIADPRLPYYLYNSLGTTNTTPQNPTEYRDGNYLAIYFSSQGPNQGFDHSRGLSMPGVYFCGGRLDLAGAGGAILISSAPGNAPVRLLNSFQVQYILAELALPNAVNSRAFLSTAIDRSFAKVNAVTTTVYPTASTISTTDINTYRNAVLAKFDAYTTDAQRLEMILTQKWIANFGNPLESYTDYRRTGYPTMNDPATDGVPFTNASRAYPFSFPYRQLDVQLNPNAPAQKLIGDASARVFWDNN